MKLNPDMLRGILAFKAHLPDYVPDPEIFTNGFRQTVLSWQDLSPSCNAFVSETGQVNIQVMEKARLIEFYKPKPRVFHGFISEEEWKCPSVVMKVVSSSRYEAPGKAVGIPVTITEGHN